MMTFYLNDCICDPINGLSQDALIDAFCAFIANYAHYTKGGSQDEYRIILGCSPQDLIIGGKSIVELEKLMPKDNEHEPLRKKAYSMFNNYPVNQYIEELKAWKDDEWQGYDFLNRDATNLFIAYKEDWCVASVPIRKDVEINPIIIHGKSNNMPIKIQNWYGKNIYEIKYHEFSDLDENERNLKTFPYYFGGKQVTLSEEFITQYKNPHCAVSGNVINRLFEAYKERLLFPAKQDDNIVKKCEGKGNETTYELRQKGSGMRAYFYCDDDRLILASIHTKAESSSIEQTMDINHASKIIADLLM